VLDGQPPRPFDSGRLSGASERFRQNDARDERPSLAGGADGVPEARRARGALVVADNPLEWPACKREALRKRPHGDQPGVPPACRARDYPRVR
jgi:hypothetical protein